MAGGQETRAHPRPVWGEYRAEDSPRRTSVRAIHEHAALVYFTRGHGVFEMKGRQEVGEGDVVLVPAGEPHRFVGVQRWAFWGIGFCAACYAPTELASLLDPFERARDGASFVVRIPEERRAYLAQLCAQLQVETRDGSSPGPHAALVQKSLLALVLTEVARAASVTAEANSQPTLVAQVLRFIERRCLSPLSLQEVAAAAGRSRSYVTTALKRATGKSVVEWIISGRLSEARNRLLHSDERVDVIAERVGYADVTHFIRLFRRAHGLTPAAWRAAHRHPRPRD
jgi:AraC-like DNA-binding protein